MSICLLPNDQSLYRLQTLIQYQRDKLGCIDLELLAHLERTCVENQSIQSSHVFALYEIYKMMKLPLKSKNIFWKKIAKFDCFVFFLSGSNNVSLCLSNRGC